MPKSTYRECFEVIEQTADERITSPLEAYKIYDKFLLENDLDPTVYLSMAITSGGFKRDQELAVPEVIKLNSEFGSLAADTLTKQFPELDRSDIIVPSELGKVKEWSQSDYLMFWFHVILGATKDVAEEINSQVYESKIPNLSGFFDTTLDEDAKWRYYEVLTQEYINNFRKILDRSTENMQKTAPNNITAAIFILDKEVSLGAKAESLFCRKLGIPPQNQILDVAIFSDLDHEYREQISRLSELGATALGTEINFDPSFTFLGYSKDPSDPNLAFRAGFRKTGLNNTLMTKDWYAHYPEAKPPRHQGNQPLFDRINL